MPNQKISAKDRAYQYRNHGFYCSDKTTVFCKFCNCQVSWERKDSVDKHLRSTKHQDGLKSWKDGERSQIQKSIANCFSSVEKKKKSAEYLGKRITETFVKSNIPLNKLENEHVRSFLNEFVEGAGDIPCVRTIKDKHLPEMQAEREAEIKDKLREQKVAVLCDETTDSREKCVFVVMLKIIKPSDTTDVFVDVHTLETADSKTCSRAVLDTLNKFEVSLDNVVALVSDSAKYMIKCFDILSNLMSENVVTIQCWAHKLNLVLNVIGKHLPELQAAVSKVKSAFLNSRKKKYLFRKYLDETYPGQNTPLFPMPVLTRWSSWYDSVAYLAEHLVDIITFLKSENMSANNAGVDFLQNLTDEDIHAAQASAWFVKEVGSQIVDLIKLLEGDSYPTVHILNGRLREIEQILQVASSGQHSRKLKELLEAPGKVAIKHKILAALNNAASHGMVKLKSLMSSDPANSFYKSVCVFDPAEVAKINISPNLVKEIKKIVFCSALEENDVQKGYTELQCLVKNKLRSNEKVDMVCLLLGMSVNYTNFAHAVLKSIWMPCANVDCERFFSCYGNVLTDTRHRLSQNHLNMFTEMHFEN